MWSGTSCPRVPCFNFAQHFHLLPEYSLPHRVSPTGPSGRCVSGPSGSSGVRRRPSDDPLCSLTVPLLHCLNRDVVSSAVAQTARSLPDTCSSKDVKLHFCLINVIPSFMTISNLAVWRKKPFSYFCNS